MRCLYALIALSILFSTPSHAAISSNAQVVCYPAKEVIYALMTNGFVPVADLEIGSLPGIIWVRESTTDYFVFILKDKTMCEVGSGLAFHLIKRKEA